MKKHLFFSCFLITCGFVSFLVVSFHGFSCLVCNHEDQVVMFGLLSPIKIEIIVLWHIVSFEVIAMLVDS